MEERYKLELRDRDPTTLEDLNLDNCKSTQFKGLPDNLINLQQLSAINIGLTSLEGLPPLPELAVLDVSDNKLKGGVEIVAKQCPNLRKFIAVNNEFETIESLEPLKEIKELESLEIFSNGVENVEGFREKIFALFPALRELNNEDADGNLVESEGEEGEEAEDFDDLSGEDSEGDETGGPGLSYLASSHILEDEDETEDFVDEEGTEGGVPTERRGVKRRHADDGEGAGDEKK